MFFKEAGFSTNYSRRHWLRLLNVSLVMYSVRHVFFLQVQRCILKQSYKFPSRSLNVVFSRVIMDAAQKELYYDNFFCT